ncbi:50S ribosomal protein L29 [Mycoplasmoides genitalium]|uniref:Large ribosomal subunit protein uL29 n=2 Tax=Mycoplasmoides genitalium TaxID=2097 RepID=RL29_MYCGE|nr:50S ribosomal protein L29 [Mycoplasmoides genitalium]P47405.1 RecName: Full=Large ribosomal subunit protein uL29; AltName: Full=50S ribosomal protein L29 [Mycoplasmoides genitalium G37]ABY79618.1 ribosomal protein L29 [synthetic Mycoplasma genitalium JCVI-1.0]AAC71377.1 ribosomal protein L29 [Mycoplasmoides genitalium G37]AFQ02983.1 50S ribosomal protein L29 [Mycoplasmoides genitalium M2321]AFQ03472.1 50S ribosomal protein L29 [Mycoplasmoides genitalium M6282]AFQ03972.1 50S ribosomal prote
MTIAKELKQKSNEELVKLVIKLKGELLEYRFKLAHGELDKPHLIAKVRKLLAVVLTILTERKLNWQVEKDKYKLLSRKTNELIVNSWKQKLSTKPESKQETKKAEVKPKVESKPESKQETKKAEVKPLKQETKKVEVKPKVEPKPLKQETKKVEARIETKTKVESKPLKQEVKKVEAKKSVSKPQKPVKAKMIKTKEKKQ